MTNVTFEGFNTRKFRVGLPVAIGIVLVLAMSLVATIAQPTAYHAFHDSRSFAGIPNFLNVISNLAFLYVGMAGMYWMVRNAEKFSAQLRLCYHVMFAGVFLTAFGSSYYHWSPDNNTLLLDRLPIALTAVSLIAAFLVERLNLGLVAGRALLAGLNAYAIASVLYWHAVDDLRFYLVVQIFPFLVIPALLYFAPARYTRSKDWMVALGIYVVAKGIELQDVQIGEALVIVSGHPLKHLIAALAIYWIYRMLRLRTWVELEDCHSAASRSANSP